MAIFEKLTEVKFDKTFRLMKRRISRKDFGVWLCFLSD